MGDVSKFQLEKLQGGSAIRVRAHGHSMSGRIEDGSLVEIRPLLQDEEVVPGDIVLCRLRGNEILHLVKAVRGSDQYLIANNHGHVNGWVSRGAIHGKFAGVVDEP